jgi:hypothetical protein
MLLGLAWWQYRWSMTCIFKEKQEELGDRVEMGGLKERENGLKMTYSFLA